MKKEFDSMIALHFDGKFIKDEVNSAIRQRDTGSASKYFKRVTAKER